MKLLFHCCCAPCAAASTESLSGEGINPTLYWYNPNIHPRAEYRRRRDALSAFAAATNLTLEIAGEYDEDFFLNRLGGETEKPERCKQCYRMRLEQAAVYAAEHGFDAFSTSLLISPYQQHDLIRSLGEELGAQHGIKFLYRDFRPLFRQSQNQARALGLYMQKYCGCTFSAEEKNAPLPVLDEKINPLFQRLALVTGAEALEKLARTKILLVGAGGVGSWCAEALVRSGVGAISLVDFDTVCATNVNRQVQATSRTLGCDKVEVLQERLLEINPNCEVTAWKKMFSRENAAEFGIAAMDYVIDAIDSVDHKLDLIEASCAAGVTLFSSMGMGRRLDPTRIKTASIWKTHDCSLARLVRQGLRKRNFNGDFIAVYSDEQHGQTKGSAVMVTAAAGMVLASLVLRDIMEQQQGSNNEQ